MLVISFQFSIRVDRSGIRIYSIGMSGEGDPIVPGNVDLGTCGVDYFGDGFCESLEYCYYLSLIRNQLTAGGLNQDEARSFLDTTCDLAEELSCACLTQVIARRAEWQNEHPE